VTNGVRNQEIGAALAFKAGDAFERTLQTALIAATCLGMHPHTGGHQRTADRGARNDAATR
jgi:hypothetical protein